jgi:drug/metabolite transporter (DMT)-like permease
VVGVTLSMTGVVLIVLRGDSGALGSTTLNLGDLLVLGGVLCWAAYTSLLRLRPGIDPLCFLAATFVIGAVAMAPPAAVEWAQGDRIHWTSGALWAVAYVAVLPSVVAYSLFNAAVARLGAGPAGQAINLMPVFGAILAVVLLHEPLHPYHLVGMALVLGGIGFAAIASRVFSHRAAGTC